MRWTQSFPIPPALSGSFNLTAGSPQLFTLEALPPRGDGPQRNEQWTLTRIYLPGGIFAAGSPPPVNVQIIVQLLQTGAPVWARPIVGTMINTGSAASIGNVMVAEDFTNPIILRSGDSALTLQAIVTVDQAATVTVGVAYQFTPANTPNPGNIIYEAISLDDPNYGNS